MLSLMIDLCQLKSILEDNHVESADSERLLLLTFQIHECVFIGALGGGSPMSHVKSKQWLYVDCHYFYNFHVDFIMVKCYMSDLFFPMSISFMSHVDFKKWLCRPVKFKGQGPFYIKIYCGQAKHLPSAPGILRGGSRGGGGFLEVRTPPPPFGGPQTA